MAYTFCLRIQNHQEPVALLHGCCHTLTEAFVFFVCNNGFIDYNLDVVILITVQLHSVYYLTDFSVYPHIQITFLANLLEKFLVMPLTGSYQRSQYKNALSFVVAVNQFDNLFFRIFHHLLTGKIRIGRSGTCKQQSQVIVYFGSSTYRRTWILVCCLLLYRNNRAQSGNLVYIRTLHSTQEISGIRRKSFDVPPLSFRKNRIKSQRRFSAATQACNHCQAVTRYLYIYVL